MRCDSYTVKNSGQWKANNKLTLLRKSISFYSRVTNQRSKWAKIL
jgi:hypothetical protein